MAERDYTFDLLDNTRNCLCMSCISQSIIGSDGTENDYVYIKCILKTLNNPIRSVLGPQQNILEISLSVCVWDGPNG